MRNPTVEDLVRLYGMQPHPEGGFYKETHRSAGVIRREALSAGFHGDRNHSTAIFYLLPKGTRSTLHRIASDEIFHFYLGGPMTLVRISPHGSVEEIVLGPDVLAGQKLQYVVPAGDWFGGYPNPGTEYALVGCTVAPGFDFADFEIAERARLAREFPHLSLLIDRFRD